MHDLNHLRYRADLVIATIGILAVIVPMIWLHHCGIGRGLTDNEMVTRRVNEDNYKSILDTKTLRHELEQCRQKTKETKRHWDDSIKTCLGQIGHLSKQLRKTRTHCPPEKEEKDGDSGD
jgi:hypothetical protein